jgi:hypothetical protein
LKIFGIGLNKTGTSSLHRALTALGYTSIHAGGPPFRALIDRAIDEQVPLLTHLPEADAYSDLGRLTTNFALLDAQYPGSRFVLTTRPVDEWLDSRRRHVERNRERKERGQYDGVFLNIDLDRWRQDFENHHRAVRSYYADRDNLLEMRITEGDGYDELCPFLGVDIPEDPFPWTNRDLSTVNPARRLWWKLRRR